MNGAVPVRGVEPRSTASETVVLPLNDTGACTARMRGRVCGAGRIHFFGNPAPSARDRGAGDGNRTRDRGLGGRCVATTLHPRAALLRSGRRESNPRSRSGAPVCRLQHFARKRSVPAARVELARHGFWDRCLFRLGYAGLGSDGGTRTLNLRGLSAAPLPNWATSPWRRAGDSNPQTPKGHPLSRRAPGADAGRTLLGPTPRSRTGTFRSSGGRADQLRQSGSCRYLRRDSNPQPPD
jgi:hypothetical protein